MFHVSHVACHVSPVTCHLSPVTCHLSHVKIYFFFFLLLSKKNEQSGGAGRWRVCYQRGLPRLVLYEYKVKFHCISIIAMLTDRCVYWVCYLFSGNQLIRVNLTVEFKVVFKNMFIWQLDGVGPVDNRPSTDKLHHFVQKKKKMWLVSCDMWHVTHVTCDT